MNKDLTNKVVLVTGGGSGIGKAIAQKMASKGAKVVVNDIDKKALSAFRQEAINNKDNFLFSVGDISQESYQAKLVKETVKTFSRIDILVNNVGVGSGKNFFEMDSDSLKKAVESNLIAPFFFTQKVANIMIKENIEGNIIFLSSIHRKIPCGNADYSLTKRALGMLVKELAYDLGSFGIRVNGIAPGRITAQTLEDPRVPFKNQTGTPVDIANLAVFLANNKLSGYITGDILTVDGGLSLLFER